ncbi:MAG: hypothetical protein FWG14_07605 [Peptococcaceae bacterium]|nr:hypothetical protein [Peptococcaceae bacterium]
MSYKYYKTEVIELVILETEERGDLSLSSCPADTSTIRRWINQFRERGEQAAGLLLSLLCTVYEQHISAIKLQAKGLLKRLSRLAQELPVPKTTTLIGAINVVAGFGRRRRQLPQ